MSGADNGVPGNAGGSAALDGFEYGDVVEHKMNTDVFGVAIGFQGTLVGIRTSPGLLTYWFHEWELRLVEDDEYTGPPAKEADVVGDNVIDFTKERALRANTKTKGVA